MGDYFLIKVFDLWPILLIEVCRLDSILSKEMTKLNLANFSVVLPDSIPIGPSSVEFLQHKENNDVSQWEESH
jgi:hypothetical protein